MHAADIRAVRSDRNSRDVLLRHGLHHVRYARHAKGISTKSGREKMICFLRKNPQMPVVQAVAETGHGVLLSPKHLKAVASRIGLVDSTNCVRCWELIGRRACFLSRNRGGRRRACDVNSRDSLANTCRGPAYSRGSDGIIPSDGKWAA